jgi:predicted nucleic acid-binding protein
LEILEALPIVIVHPNNEQSLFDLAKLARVHQLTAYDAAYLNLAQLEQASLLTLDANLIDAARRIDVPLITMQ